MKNSIVAITATLITGLMGCGQHAGDENAVPDQTHNVKIVPASFQYADRLTNEKYQAAIRGFFEKNFGRQGFNGAYLVAKDGAIISEGYEGYRDLQSREGELGEHDAFHLASVSKTFTAMAVLKLWENGQLDINNDLSLYFEKFPYPGTTIKMLLSHRSGLPNYTNYLDVYHWDKKKQVTNLDVLSSLYTLHPPLQFPTGKRFAYCNTNYALLALVVEKVTGKHFPDYMRETFFEPLGMEDSYIFQPQDEERSLPSYEWNNRKYGLEFMDLVYGDKNVYSTPRDMLKWDQALYSGKLFRDSTLQAAFTGYSYEKKGARNYGLGWRLTEVDNGKKIVYHNGWWHGNNTVFIRLLDEHATIIVLGNKFNKGIYRSKQLCDLFGDYRQSNKLFQESDMEATDHIAAGGSQ
ncbi:MAG TPA: serine hydrolase domain-containing protein [Flavihumibacter sp.]|nr:beta-lactamase family protein [Bacteroidota bacterium]HOA38367.1 serine hydrolase domain-containing protein [Flavihumibacter sp.]HQD08498.1 serine hydrolase domain-containing protein [Flavihumibacter sp.]